ncbi:nucleotidyltransferase family protein [Cognatishimia sp. D5M38]|uniref:Nucleotidyltransferase family protein n=1 Tax=Cognatishimia coralii TaxID=3083254 RepID=A0ABU8QD20_9RHOB
MLAILVLAAGQSSRMRGGDKLLEEVEGQPLLQKITSHALDTGAQVYVALQNADGRRAAVLPHKAHVITVPQAREGMGVTIATSIAKLPDTVSAAMILPADMPELSAVDFVAMKSAHEAAPDQILRAMSGHTPGHPVVFPRRCFDALKTLSTDQGAREVVKSESNDLGRVALPIGHAITDLDTPEDWAAWRAQQNQI